MRIHKDKTHLTQRNRDLRNVYEKMRSFLLERKVQEAKKQSGTFLEQNVCVRRRIHHTIIEETPQERIHEKSTKKS